MASSSDPARPIESDKPLVDPALSKILALLGQVVAPSALLTALLFYFGWSYTNALASEFGIDPSVLVFNTGDYILRSISIASGSLSGLLIGALAAIWAELLHQVAKGESMHTLFRKYWADSSYMTTAEFGGAVRELNAGKIKGDWPKPGETLIIPGMEGPITEKSIPEPKDFEVRAIYLTGIMAGSHNGLELIKNLKARYPSLADPTRDSRSRGKTRLRLCGRGPRSTAAFHGAPDHPGTP